jgi:hypothetical protein
VRSEDVLFVMLKIEVETELVGGLGEGVGG